MLPKTLKLLQAFKPGAFVKDPETVFDHKELSELTAVLKRFLFAPSVLRDFMQKHGVTVTPSNYYSEIPTVQEIQDSYDSTVQTYCTELFDQEKMARFLEDLTVFSQEFDPPLEASEGENFGYAWKNPMLSFSDAMSYYSIVRKEQPKNVVEIGSGFSSLVAMEAIAKNGVGKLTCIEPYPRDFLLDNDKVSLVSKRAQEITPDYLNDILEDGDILFIDSTHTVKHGSDCLQIYLNLLPSIKSNITVHVHDIYLPNPFPISLMRDRQIYWTEQYLLGAYLTDNNRTELLYSSRYNTVKNKNLLEKFMHGRFPSGGASIWFKQDKRGG
jgi:predicted phosphatase